MFDYKDKSIIITGATGALGRELCYEFAKRGAKLAICGRSSDKLSGLANDILALGGECIYKAIDISAIEQVKDFVNYVIDRYKGVDVLLNCAAMANFGSFSALTTEAIVKETAVNYLGPVYFMKEVLPLMLTKGEGQTINISSVCSFNPFPFLASYSASKAALSAMTNSLQIELSGKNIDIINVYVAKLACGLRFPPQEGSLHSMLQQKLSPKGKDNIARGGMSPKIAAKMIISSASKGKKNIHTHIVEGRIVFYFNPFITPVLKKLLYYLKVRKFKG